MMNTLLCRLPPHQFDDIQTSPSNPQLPLSENIKIFCTKMLIRNIFLIFLNGKSCNGLQIDSKFPAYLIGLL